MLSSDEGNIYDVRGTPVTTQSCKGYTRMCVSVSMNEQTLIIYAIFAWGEFILKVILCDIWVSNCV